MGVRLLEGGADDRASKLSAGDRASMKIFLRRHRESWNLIKNRLFKEPLLRGKEMAVLNSCCCSRSVRRGSFASGVFTLIFYTMIVMAGAFHVNSVVYSPALLSFSLLMVVCAGFCVVSSIVLLVGLCVDNRLMLLPWIVSVSMTTALDVVLSFYLFSEAQIDVIIAVIFVTDLLICCLNIYSILCVISQYQQYVAGRGRSGQSNGSQTLPTVHCYLSGPKSNCPAPAKVIVKVTDNGQTLLHNSDSGLTSQFTRSTELVSVGSEAPSPKDEVKETDEEKPRSPASSNPSKKTNSSLTSPRASPSPSPEHFITLFRQNGEDDECSVAQPKASGHGRRFANLKSIGVEVNLYSSSEKHPLLNTEGENPINVISYSSTVSRHEENDPSLDDREQEADVTSSLQTVLKRNATISVEL